MLETIKTDLRKIAAKTNTVAPTESKGSKLSISSMKKKLLSILFLFQHFPQQRHRLVFTIRSQTQL